MRYYQLLESETIADAKVVDFILKNCQPYLKENPKLMPIYRGFKSEKEGVVIKDIRTDRKPVDTSNEITELFNNALKSMGSNATRTNSIFVSGSSDVASAYGRPHVIFPIGNFNYTWSPKVNDLYMVIKRDLHNFYELDEQKLEEFYSDPETIQRIEYWVVTRMSTGRSSLLEDGGVYAKARNSKEVQDAVKKNIEIHKEYVRAIYRGDEGAKEKMLEYLHAHPRVDQVGNLSEEKVINFVKDNYKVDNGLQEAIETKKNEIMITGSKYVAVPTLQCADVHSELMKRL